MPEGAIVTAPTETAVTPIAAVDGMPVGVRFTAPAAMDADPV